MKLIKNKKFLVLLFLLFGLGFLRDFIFIQTNIIMFNKWSNSEYEFHSSMNWLNSFDYWTLYYAKWFLTALFIVLYFILSRHCIKLLFNQKLFLHLLFFFFLLILSFAAGSLFFGWLTDGLDKGYLFSRLFVGILQSPLPLMLIVPFGLYYNQAEK